MYVPAFCCSLLYNLTLPHPNPTPSSLLPPQSHSFRVTWDAISQTWSSKYSHQIKYNSVFQFSSVQLVSRVQLHGPHGLQHARLPCPSPTPGAYSNSCPLSRWCHTTISSSVSRLQSFPASGYFQMSQFFTSGGQSIRVSASASVLSKNIQDWFPLGWTGWISLLSKGLTSIFSNTTVQKHQFFGPLFSLLSNSHIYMTTGKIIALTRRNFVGIVMSLLFNMLSRLVTTFLPSSKRLLISWLQSPSAVILGPPQNKVCHCFPSYLLWSDGTKCHDLSFLNVEV